MSRKPGKTVNMSSGQGDFDFGEEIAEIPNFRIRSAAARPAGTTLVHAGTDTSAETLELSMSLLLNSLTALEKATAEIDSCVGQEWLIDEHDIHVLPYLQNVINETLRLFPPAPLLVPQRCGTTKRVSSRRGSRGWSKPAMPIPFGVGRRGCLGAGLAHRVVGLGLGALIQCFEWVKS
ncbi:cytochrome P450 81F3-like [Punica granatum]|uniref:Cytochrome P450 81F3-like n=1 Tax=Punica granatum TaxID=22663 RepID=A0A6P8EH60_PUNGR|nr:cytochrome P450 81F3-like [Punica granatum]